MNWEELEGYKDQIQGAYIQTDNLEDVYGGKIKQVEFYTVDNQHFIKIIPAWLAHLRTSDYNDSDDPAWKKVPATELILGSQWNTISLDDDYDGNIRIYTLTPSDHITVIYIAGGSKVEKFYLNDFPAFTDSLREIVIYLSFIFYNYIN